MKKAAGFDTSKLATKSDLASLKAEIDKIDVDKLKTVPVDLTKLSNVVNNVRVKKAIYDKLVAKIIIIIILILMDLFQKLKMTQTNQI